MKNKKSAAKTALKSVEQTPATPSTTVAKFAPATPVTKAAPAAPAPVAPAAAPVNTPTPVAAPAKTSAPVAQPKHALTTIEVKLDVGFGNTVFLRGHGAGLTWDHGLPLSCVDGKTWRWTAEARDPITFKLLLNDQIWSSGNDLSVAPGQKLEVKPQFA